MITRSIRMDFQGPQHVPPVTVEVTKGKSGFGTLSSEREGRFNSTPMKNLSVCLRHKILTPDNFWRCLSILLIFFPWVYYHNSHQIRSWNLRPGRYSRKKDWTHFKNNYTQFRSAGPTYSAIVLCIPYKSAHNIRVFPWFYHYCWSLNQTALLWIELIVAAVFYSIYIYFVQLRFDTS